MPVKTFLACIENRDYILREYAQWLISVLVSRKVDWIYFWNGLRKPIWYMRREMIKKALETDCTHLLFVDTDAVPTKEVLDKLLAYDLDVISGVCPHIDGT